MRRVNPVASITANAGGKFLAHLILFGLLSILPLNTGFSQNKEFKPDIRKTADGISYVSAGVGYDSRVNLPRFSLMLVFATRTGRYLASIETEITHGQKTDSTKIRSIGPWLHVDLPPGKYAVRARTTQGQEVRKTFTIIKGRVTRVDLVWDISDEDI